VKRKKNRRNCHTELDCTQEKTVSQKPKPLHKKTWLAENVRGNQVGGEEKKQRTQGLASAESYENEVG